MREFVRLTEHCEWEGETWHVYIPIEGNDAGILQLRALAAADLGWEVSDRTYTESEVDVLCAAGGSTTYLAEHAKVDGVLSLPDDAGEDMEALSDWLYKGQIRSYVTQRGTPA